MSKQKVTVFWFRRDLRLHDNHGLLRALSGQYPVLPVFIFDGETLPGSNDPGDQRLVFINQNLAHMNREIQKAGSAILSIHGRTVDAFNKICARFDVQNVYANTEYEPHALKRDEQVREMLKAKGIPFITLKDHVIFEKSEIMNQDGHPFRVYTAYARSWKRKLQENEIPHYGSEHLKHRFLKSSPELLPDQKNMGSADSTSGIPALFPDLDKIKSYHIARDYPGGDGTLKMSVPLRFGTASVRQMVRLGMQWNEHWLNQLIWREFFTMILYHFPQVVTQNFNRKFDGFQWRNDETEFRRWCRGETGYPLVDAGMKELNSTGFMHNRVRMVAASFLTKHLLIDWRWGEAWFAEKLLDFDLASNNGNWQWVAGSGADAAPFFRIFNPHVQAKKFDADGQYVKKWLDKSQITYNQPIIDHSVARERALSAYRRMVAEQIHGVKDGIPDLTGK